MRPTQLASLVLLGLLVSASWAQAGRPRVPVRPFNAPKITKNQPMQSWVVEGFGREQQDAEQDAVEKAKADVLSYLAKQGLVLKSDLPASFFRKLVKKFEPAEDKDLEVAGIDPLKHVNGYVELGLQDYRHILKIESELRGEERMILLGKLLAGVVAFLLTVAGYFRLEEATKGYYTTLLRLGALGFVAAVGVGLWLIS